MRPRRRAGCRHRCTMRRRPWAVQRHRCTMPGGASMTPPRTGEFPLKRGLARVSGRCHPCTTSQVSRPPRTASPLHYAFGRRAAPRSVTVALRLACLARDCHRCTRSAERSTVTLALCFQARGRLDCPTGHASRERVTVALGPGVGVTVALGGTSPERVMIGWGHRSPPEPPP